MIVEDIRAKIIKLMKLSNDSGQNAEYKSVKDFKEEYYIQLKEDTSDSFLISMIRGENLQRPEIGCFLSQEHHRIV